MLTEGKVVLSLPHPTWPLKVFQAMKFKPCLRWQFFPTFTCFPCLDGGHWPQSCAQQCWVAKDLKERRWAGVLVWAWVIRNVQLSLDVQPSPPVWNCPGEMPDEEKGDLEIKSCWKALPAAWGEMDKAVVVLTSLPRPPKFLPLLLDSSFFLLIPPVVPL